MKWPRFFKTPTLPRLLFSNLTWQRKVNENTLYLTFDDGPDTTVTPWLLDTLSKYEAEGTFFCVGANAKDFPGLLDRILKEGHQVGNHTFYHTDGWKTTKENYVNDIKKGEPFIPSSYFRPPYGKIRPDQVKALREQGYEIIMWDVLSYDFDQSISPKEALKKCVDHTVPGSIIVFHDNAKAFENLKRILPEFLNHFRQKGYQFKAL